MGCSTSRPEIGDTGYIIIKRFGVKFSVEVTFNKYHDGFPRPYNFKPKNNLDIGYTRCEPEYWYKVMPAINNQFTKPLYICDEHKFEKVEPQHCENHILFYKSLYTTEQKQINLLDPASMKLIKNKPSPKNLVDKTYYYNDTVNKIWRKSTVIDQQYDYLLLESKQGRHWCLFKELRETISHEYDGKTIYVADNDAHKYIRSVVDREYDNILYATGENGKKYSVGKYYSDKWWLEPPAKPLVGQKIYYADPEKREFHQITVTDQYKDQLCDQDGQWRIELVFRNKDGDLMYQPPATTDINTKIWYDNGTKYIKDQYTKKFEYYNHPTEYFVGNCQRWFRHGELIWYDPDRDVGKPCYLICGETIKEYIICRFYHHCYLVEDIFTKNQQWIKAAQLYMHIQNAETKLKQIKLECERKSRAAAHQRRAVEAARDAENRRARYESAQHRKREKKQYEQQQQRNRNRSNFGHVGIDSHGDGIIGLGSGIGMTTDGGIAMRLGNSNMYMTAGGRNGGAGIGYAGGMGGFEF